MLEFPRELPRESSAIAPKSPCYSSRVALLLSGFAMTNCIGSCQFVRLLLALISVLNNCFKRVQKSSNVNFFNQHHNGYTLKTLIKFVNFKQESCQETCYTKVVLFLFFVCLKISTTTPNSGRSIQTSQDFFLLKMRPKVFDQE